MNWKDAALRRWNHLSPRVRRPVLIGVDAAKRWSADLGPQLGASVAFYTMFALAPLLVIAIAIAAWVFGEEAARGQIVGQISGLVGTDAAKGIEAMISAANKDKGSGIVASISGLVALLAGASGVFNVLRAALNAIGHVSPRSGAIGAFVRAKLIAFALVLGFGFLAVTSLLLSAVLSAFGAWLGALLPGVEFLLSLLDFVVSTAVLTVAFAALLRWLPDASPSRHGMWAGALAASLLFAIGKHLIGLYLGRASVSSSYGAAGSFVVVMLWVYYSAQILLYGAAVAASIDERRPGMADAVPEPKARRAAKAATVRQRLQATRNEMRAVLRLPRLVLPEPAPDAAPQQRVHAVAAEHRAREAANDAQRSAA